MEVKFGKYINEEYLTRATDSYGNSLEIFVNPSTKDLKDMKGTFVRFIANTKKKRVYVWDGSYLIHSSVWKELVNQGYEKRLSVYGPDHLLAGYARKRGGALYVDHETFNCENTNFEKHDWKWIDKYVKDFTKEMIKWRSEYFK